MQCWVLHTWGESLPASDKMSPASFGSLLLKAVTCTGECTRVMLLGLRARAAGQASCSITRIVSFVDDTPRITMTLPPPPAL